MKWHFRRWPFLGHLAAAALMTCSLGVVSAALIARKDQALIEVQTRVSQSQDRVALFNSRHAEKSVQVPNFTERLPRRSTAASVLSDLGVHAGALGVVVASVSVSDVSPTDRNWGYVQMEASFRGSYDAIKALIAELTARYPSVALHSLSVKGQAIVATPLEAQAVLHVFAKD
jgi:hypothetical protein